jgi:hypothetical protein
VTGATADLIVNSPGTTAFGGAVSLQSLATNAGGTTAINGASVATTGNQSYGDAVTLGAGVKTLSGANVSLASTVTGATADLTASSPGTTTFGGAVSTQSLTTDAGGTTAINAGSVATSGNQVYADPVSLGSGTQALSGANVRFASTVDGPGALSVASSGSTRFEGVVGGAARLASLTTDAPGTTVLAVAAAGDDVRTTGAQTYDDAVLLEQDTTLDAGPNSVITLGANVGSSIGTRDLTVRAEQIRIGGNLGGANPLGDITLDVVDTASSTSDYIEFVGAGNQTVTATGALAVNSDGRAAPGPVAATVFKRSGNLTLSGDSVAFGRRDKVTVIGDLAITATGAATQLRVPDLTALNISLTAPSLVLLGREPGLTSVGVVTDHGMDLVANSVTINVGVVGGQPDITVDPALPQSPVKVGTLNASGATVNGNGPTSPLAPVAIFSNSNQALSATDLTDPATSTVLDLEAAGPARGSERPPASPVFMLIAKPSGGVNAAAASEKPLRSSEVTAFLRCDPEDEECAEKAVGAARARSKEANELRQSYAKLFGASAEPAGKSAAELSKAALQLAVDAYRRNTNTEPSGSAFRQFCEGSAEHAKAVDVLNELRSNLRLARAFGRSGEGLGDYKQQALGRVLPEGLSMEALEAAVEAGGVGPQK